MPNLIQKALCTYTNTTDNPTYKEVQQTYRDHTQRHNRPTETIHGGTTDPQRPYTEAQPKYRDHTEAQQTYRDHTEAQQTYRDHTQRHNKPTETIQRHNRPTETIHRGTTEAQRPYRGTTDLQRPHTAVQQIYRAIKNQAVCRTQRIWQQRQRWESRSPLTHGT